MILNFLLLIHLCHCKDIIYNHKNKEKNLYFVFTTFRHGARKPLSKVDFFGNFNYSAGALTKYGKIQHLEIGRKYRKRYSNFMNINFDKKEIYIRSSNIRRTIVSTEKELEGFFNKSINRSNIFIVKSGYSMKLFSLDRKEQMEMKKYYRSCLKRNLAKNYINIYNRKIFPNIKNCHLMENISDSGINRFCDSIISHYFEYIYDNETNNIISRCSSESINQFYDFCIKYYDSFRGFNEYNGYILYNLFQHIFKNMNNAIKGKSKLKMMMIGGHDSSIDQFINFLDKLKIIPRTNYPHFAFNLVIELRKYNQDFYLEFYYNDVLKYNNTLDKFKSILENSIYSNLYNYCGKMSKTIYNEKKIIQKTEKNNYTVNSIKKNKREKAKIFRNNQSKNKLNRINILNNNDMKKESFSLISTDINEIKAKNEAKYEKNLLKKLLNFLSQKSIKYFFIVLIIIVFLIKFSIKKKHQKKNYIMFRENRDKIINKIQVY